MGLLIQTNFETREGFAVSQVYMRILQLVCNIQNGANVDVTIITQTYVSREKRLRNAPLLSVPALSDYVKLSTDISNVGSFTFLYEQVKNMLETSGFTYTDVFECEPEPPTTTAEPETTPEPPTTTAEPQPPATTTEPETTTEPSVSQQSSESTP